MARALGNGSGVVSVASHSPNGRAGVAIDAVEDDGVLERESEGICKRGTLGVMPTADAGCARLPRMKRFAAGVSCAPAAALSSQDLLRMPGRGSMSGSWMLLRMLERASMSGSRRIGDETGGR